MGLVLTSGGSYLDSQIVTDLGTLVSNISTWITGNVYLTIFFTLGLIGIAVALFHKLKNIVR